MDYVSYPWFEADIRCPADDGDTTMVDDKYWCGVADAFVPIVDEPIALAVIECGGECCCCWCACNDADVVDDVTMTFVAFVKLEFDDGEFSPDVDGIDDGS